jgi:hypothetical protein
MPTMEKGSLIPPQQDAEFVLLIASFETTLLIAIRWLLQLLRQRMRAGIPRASSPHFVLDFPSRQAARPSPVVLNI